MAYNPDWNRLDEIFAGNSKAQIVDTGTGQLNVIIDNTTVGVFNGNGLTLATGASINEFSTDSNLAGNSDNAVPTEKAVKGYVDAQISAITTNKISQGDSFVQVVDTTSVGNIDFVTDGIAIGNFTSSEQIIGRTNSGHLKVTPGDGSLHFSVGSTDIVQIENNTQQIGLTSSYIKNDTSNSQFDIVEGGSNVGHFGASDAIQRIGPTSNARLEVDNSADPTKVSLYGGDNNYLMIEQAAGGGGGTLHYYEGGTEIIKADSTTVRLGQAPDDHLILDYSNHTLVVDHHGTTILSTTETQQILGVSGDSRIDINQSADTIDLYAGASKVFAGSLTSVTMGISGDTFITVDETNDQVNITAGNQSQILVETSGTTVYDDLTVTGNLFVDGTTFVINNQEVTTADNIIVLNDGEAGAGVTKGTAGIEIDRGTLTNYQFIFNESSDTFRIGEIGSLQAVATREDSPGSTRVPWWNDTAKRFDTLGNSYITIDTSGNAINGVANSTNVFNLGETSQRIGVAADTNITLDQTANTITIEAANVTVGTFDANGLTLANGTSINEFSTDGTLAGDSDDAVPTEKAVKTYVDAQIGGAVAHNSTTGLQGGDATSSEYYHISGDVYNFLDASSTNLLLGNSSAGHAVIDTDDNSFTFYSNTTPYLTVDNLGITLQFGASVNEFSVDGTLAGDSDDAVPTEKAVKTYVDSQISNKQHNTLAGLQGGDSTSSEYYHLIKQVYDSLFSVSGSVVGFGDSSYSRMEVTTGGGGGSKIEFKSEFNTNLTITGSGIALGSGTTINEFSIDGTLVDNSDSAVPTEKAVKTYVDTEISNLESKLDLINVSTISADSTAVSGDVLLVNTSGGNVTVTMTEASDARIIVKKTSSDSNSVIVVGASGTIDGSANSTFSTQYQSYAYVCNGTNWFII